MTPQKLYIPTTGLNFNNILASESISPAEFYPNRGFGYKRYEKVEPNNLNKRILLYEKYPIFDINNKEIESYPLVIEIDTYTIPDDTIQKFENGIFFSEETLYLNPFTTNFYFRNEIEKRSIISKVEQSLNTKTLPLYNNNLHIKPNDIESFTWQYYETPDSEADFSKFISKDRLKNKIKGFLYAYAIGAKKSLSPEIVSIKGSSKKLRNIVSSVITSSDGKPTINQEKQTLNLYQKINSNFFIAEELDSKLQKIINEKIEKYGCVNFEEILKKEGLYDEWIHKQELRQTYKVPNFNFYLFIDNQKGKDNKRNLENQKYFETYFDELETAINKLTTQKILNISKLPQIQHSCRIENIPDQKEFLVKLFNEFLTENWNGEEFISSRLEFATKGGKLFKEELQEKWEKSSTKIYINDLRNNLASSTPFDIQTENLTLKSFAAFCQKGEEDIEKLVEFLILNEIGDFRIAFGLWGIVFGFANMPKTLTNDLFLSNNLDYISAIYKSIFKKIHEIELEGKIKKFQIQEYYNNPNTINRPLNQKEKIVDNIYKTSNNLEKQDQTTIEALKIRQILTSKKIKQTDQILEIWKENNFLVNEKLFASISKVRGVGDKLLDKIKECFNFRNNAISSVTQSIFTNESTGHFLEDYEFLTTSPDFIKIVSKEKNWQNDLKWFISEYKNPESRYYGSGSGKGPSSKDNKTVIQKFMYYKKGLYRDSEIFLKHIYLNID